MEKTKLTAGLTIGLTTDSRAAIQISPNLDCSTAFRLLGTLATHMLNAYYTVAAHDLEINHASGATPKQQKLSKKELEAAKLGIKESMYDAVDTLFANVLKDFYPEAAKFNLEDEAILELTNKKIEEEYAKLPEAERNARKAEYDAMATYFKKRAEEGITNDKSGRSEESKA